MAAGSSIVLGGAVLLAGLGHHAPRPESSPLAVAAVAGDVQEVGALLSRGADPNAFSDHGFTPLMWAARFGQLETMRALVDAGAELDVQDRGPNGWTAILHATHKHQTKAALALLEWGAAPDRAAPNGMTPLMRAACEDEPEIVRALLARGADPRAENLDHMNSLTYAVQGGNPEIARALLAAAPDLRYHDNLDGLLAKVFARLSGHTEVLAVVGAAGRRR